MKQRLRRLLAYVLPVMIAVAVPLLFSRCTPQWLPDGNSFVFTSATGEVSVYNIATKKRQLLTTLKAPVAGLGVWPSGDRVAIVKPVEVEGGSGMQIVVLDMQGKQKHASPAYKLKSAGKEKGILGFLVETFVSPDGKHVVTFMPAAQSAVIYNVEQRKFRTIEKAASLSLLGTMNAAAGEDGNKVPWAFSVAPFTPDGKGFVMLHTDGGDDMSFGVMNWGDEKPRKLTLPEEKLKALEKALNSTGFPVATVPRWKGGVLSMHLGDSTLRIDPKMRVATLSKDMRSDHLHQHAEKNKVRVLCELADGGLLQATKTHLQVWKRGGETVQVGPLNPGQFLSLSLSPDGRRALVRTMAEQDLLRVIDNRGRVLAEIKQPSLLGK